MAYRNAFPYEDSAFRRLVARQGDIHDVSVRGVDSIMMRRRWKCNGTITRRRRMRMVIGPG